MIHTRAFASLLLAGLFATGCAPKTDTTLAPPPVDQNPEPQLASDVRARVQQLVQLADEYAANAKALPGRNEAEDRAQVTQQFALLVRILPSLSGPDMTGDFRQQLRIIESTRAMLGTSADLAAEPTIDSGMRAAHRALASVAARAFADQPDVAKQLDAMRDRVAELDTVSGPIHRLVVAQAFQASAQAVSTMANALHQRLNDPSAAANKTPATTTPPAPVTPTPPTPTEAPKPEASKPATPTPEAPKPEAPKPAEAPKPELNK